ncbi:MULTISPECIES: TetR/AcrR family transcriptional regulator [Cohnella]|uniref:TetR/AcrR family transcriptional regulator n=1 Tax=Cohnella TaxID=329857 RepID=UPI0009BB7292|nr:MULTISPECIES: TetR-like C-terminal domain-containing protein [Cohnella]
MENRTTRIDPRILRTRQLLRDAFVELLQEMDVEKISVNRLAERATINRVTFYLHYRDIPDMMEKLADEMNEDFSRILHGKSQSAEASPEGKEATLVELLEHIAHNAKFYKAVLATKRLPIFTERLSKLLSEMITERLEKSEKDVLASGLTVRRDIAIWFGSSALIGVIISWLRNDMPYSPHFLAEQFSMLTSSRSR